MQRITAAILVALAFAFAAHAQTYPTKPIRLVVPFAPGGSSTMVGALRWRRRWRRASASVVIENKPRRRRQHRHAGSRAAPTPDGYTLIIGHVGSLAMNPYMYEQAALRRGPGLRAGVAARDRAEHLRRLRTSVPAKDLREFVALAKSEARASSTTVSAGNGSRRPPRDGVPQAGRRHRRCSTCRTRAPGRTSPISSPAARRRPPPARRR